jgi:transposase
MSEALAVSLRMRAPKRMAAGTSHREAAGRFGVSAAKISRRRKRERKQGASRPKAQGGDVCCIHCLQAGHLQEPHF